MFQNIFFFFKLINLSKNQLKLLSRKKIVDKMVCQEIEVGEEKEKTK
jgi:hypothetical protein